MVFRLRRLEVSKRETLSLSLRLRDGRTGAPGAWSGTCPVLVKLVFDICQVIVHCPSGVYLKQIWMGRLRCAYGRAIGNYP